MSIGKSSIARAASATATQTKTTTSQNVMASFSIDKIGLLSIASTPDDVDGLKSSIAKRGVISPVVVAVTTKGDVWLVDGYRRLFAAKELNISTLNGTVISVETKREANNLYSELCKTKPTIKSDNIHEEKFHVLCVKDHDLPAYLL